MISKNQIKHIASLKSSKFRSEYNEFIVEGEKMVSELFNSSFKIKQIFATEDWISSNQELSSNTIEFEKVSPKELGRISALKTPNKVLALVSIPKPNFTTINYDQLILVLDKLQDPGNLGTLVRTADWFGIKDIICSKDTVSLYNPKVIQSTMGSFTRVNLHYTALKGVLKGISKELSVYGSLLEGKSLFQEKLSDKGLIIIGNESQGISKEIQSFVSHKISIPSFATNKDNQAESLNASLATGIICAEFRRQNS
jgi:TrmH family RNA methyltransferase